MTNTTHLRELIERATKGPWEWRNDQLSTPNYAIKQWTISPGVLIADCNDGTPGGDDLDQANAALIVALVNQAPAMLDELDALREVVYLNVDPCDVRPEHQAIVDAAAALKQGTPT